MNIIINKDSYIPIYKQIYEQIKTQIELGTISNEEVLPSVRVLAKKLKVSVLTTQKAYELLREEQIIITSSGKGSFVNANKIDNHKEKNTTFKDESLELKILDLISYSSSKNIDKEYLINLISEIWDRR